MAASGWNKEPPAPTLPDDVIAGTRDRYVTAYERLTGERWGDRGAIGLVRWLAEVQVTLRPGIADPEGTTIAGGLRSLGYDSVSEVRAGKLLRITFDAPRTHAAAEEAVAEMCRRLLANPVMEVATWQLRADEQVDLDEPVTSAADAADERAAHQRRRLPGNVERA